MRIPAAIRKRDGTLAYSDRERISAAVVEEVQTAVERTLVRRARCDRARRIPGWPEMPAIPAAGSIPGVPPIEEVIARYQQRSKRDLAPLDYYICIAFGYWRLAVILEGVHSPFASGAYGETDSTHTAFADLAHELLAKADRRSASLSVW
jgi:hypothetical protein